MPTPYFHNVFTLPHEFNGLILYSERNRRALLGLLFRAAAKTLLAFGQNNLGGKLGLTLVLHTWNQKLGAHFHVHALTRIIHETQRIAGGEAWRVRLRSVSAG